MAQDLNKIFLNVPEAKKNDFTTDAELANHASQIAFIHGAGTIATHGEIFTGGTNKDIVVKGGPLDDDTTDSWPEEWTTKDGKRIIPANTSLQQILTYLFNATIPGVVGGSAGWVKTPAIGAPITSITYNNQYGSTGTATIDVSLPLGSQITFSYTANSQITNTTQKVSVYAYYTQNGINKPSGYFLDYAEELTPSDTTDVYTETVTATTSGTSAATATFNSSAITSGAQTYVTSTSALQYTVSNTGISVNPVNFDEHTFYAANNNGEKLTDTSKNQVYTISGTQGITSITPSKDKTIKVTGYKPTFHGKAENTAMLPADITADFIDDYSQKNGDPDTAWKIDPGTGTIFVAVPEGNRNYGKKYALWKNQMGAEWGSKFATTIEYEHPNIGIKTNYKVFFMTNPQVSQGTSAEDYSLSFE